MFSRSSTAIHIGCKSNSVLFENRGIIVGGYLRHIE